MRVNKPGISNGFRDKKGWSLKSIGFLPRWIILGIDLGIVMASSVITVLLLDSLSSFNYTKFNYGLAFSLTVAVFFFTFVFYRTYSGLIRHSTFIDGIKLLVATTTAFLILFSINIIGENFFDNRIFLNPGLVIFSVITFSLLFLFRIMVKNVFDNYLNKTPKKEENRAFILGTDSNAISVANALKLENPKRFDIVGFVDRSNKNITKRILDLPIMDTRRGIIQVMLRLKVKSLILADSQLTKAEKNALVDQCLEKGIQVLTAPLVSDWKSEKELSKKVKNIRIEDLLERDPIQLDNPAICENIKGQVILVTGGAGSIGSEIARQVAYFKPSALLILDQAETPLHEISMEIDNNFPEINAIPVLADVRSETMMEDIFLRYRPDIIFHAAAYKHVPLMEKNPNQAVAVNIKGTKIVADLAIKYNAHRFVMVSTDKAVNPSNVMGASKRVAEIYVQSLYHGLGHKNHKTKFITTRFGNVLGSNGSVVPLFAKQIEQGGPITITHPDIIRYFMTIPEACQLVLEAGISGDGGEIFLFDMGKPVRILDLAVKMIRLAGFIPNEEIKIKYVGLRPGEKLYEELLNDNSISLPTHHDKILISTDEPMDFKHVSSSIDKIINFSISSDPYETVSCIKKLVPEFKSMNSEYQRLDVVSERSTMNAK